MLALGVQSDSSLMRHELGYILGQMQNPAASVTLHNILEDESEDVLVRHEARNHRRTYFRLNLLAVFLNLQCAEALGAIGLPSSLDTLCRLSNHEFPEIAETCQISRDMIRWRMAAAPSEKELEICKYRSVDPAPPFKPDSHSLEELAKILVDQDLPLFDRYRAMFSLRNLDNDDSCSALLQGLRDNSALFRHEIAYVLGQMQRACAVDALSSLLSNKDEHRMVRHEAAESLGAIGGDRVNTILTGFVLDEELVVKQSCEVALDTMEYWSSYSAAGSNNGLSNPDNTSVSSKYW